MLTNKEKHDILLDRVSESLNYARELQDYFDKGMVDEDQFSLLSNEINEQMRIHQALTNMLEML
jgi:hypothetical protein